MCQERGGPVSNKSASGANMNISAKQLQDELRRVKGKKRSGGAFRSAISMVLTAAIIVAAVVMALPVLKITGNSMGDTLQNGDIVAVFRTQSIDRGDLIAFSYNSKILTKRVIALAGDVVEIYEDGGVSVNGQVLDEPYITQMAVGECDLVMPYTVPEDRIFVMGDDRVVSVDSRSEAVGCVADEQIIGRIAVRIWPMDRFSTFISLGELLGEDK